MPFYEKGAVKIYYEEAGSGFPLLIIPGGGLNATIAYTRNTATAPFDAMAELKDQYRCIAFDLRNATAGQSTGPVEVDRPWESYTDDMLGLMDHLGIDRFAVLGYCIGGPFIWKLLERAPERVVAAVPTQPSGFRPTQPDLFFKNNMGGWAPAICERRRDVTMQMCEAFLTNMYAKRADFVFSVSRDSVRGCQTPVLVLPDDVLAHPYAVAMETAYLAPNAQASFYPWKDNPEKVRLVVRHVRTFLRANTPAR